MTTQKQGIKQELALNSNFGNELHFQNMETAA